jgi:hypothetical protein
LLLLLLQFIRDVETLKENVGVSMKANMERDAAENTAFREFWSSVSSAMVLLKNRMVDGVVPSQCGICLRSDFKLTSDRQQLDVYHCPQVRCRAVNAICTLCVAKCKTCLMPGCKGKLKCRRLPDERPPQAGGGGGGGGGGGFSPDG